MRRMKFFRSFLIIMAALFVAVMFSACDFFSYKKGTSQEELEYQRNLEQKQTEYIESLNGLSSEDAYYEEERKAYVLCLLEGVNELRDCEKIEQLDTVFEKRKDAILSIKTISDYEEEERLKSEQLAKAKEEFVSKLNALSAEENYREEELVTYRFYLKAATDEINSCETQEFLEEIFNTYKEVIISIKTASEYEAEEAAAFATFCETKIQEIRNHLTLSEYRKEQADQITAYISEYETRIEEATDYSIIENIVREYKITVYSIKTDAELYAEELSELKAELSSSLANTYKLSLYREAEGFTVQELLKAFEASLTILEKKEDVLSQYVLSKNKLDSIKTSSALDAEDRENLIEELYAQLLDEIENNIDEDEKEEYFVKAEIVFSSMKDRVSLEGIREEYRTFAQEIAYAHGAFLDILKEELSDFKSTVIYREKEQSEFNAIKEEYLAKFTDDLDVDSAKVLLQEAKEAISKIKSNEELWDESLTEFRNKLNILYGNAILKEPRSLTEANDYYELADIIDYYAFYQLSGTEFVCDTFRVKLNFDHNDAQTELVNVYWYCELIRTAVGIANYFENNSDYIVFQLTPYDFASVSNERPVLNRLQSVVEFDSDKSQMTTRSEGFDDFAYYDYKRTITVWNSQQLWYALEHEYVPVCVPDSPAELVMNRAKEILREIIMEGMSDEEKIFQIYSWFGNCGQHDNDYGVYLNNDEMIAKLRSFHIEGMLLDGLGVCYSCAKLNLLFLRLEGIKAYYAFAAIHNQYIGYRYPISAGHAYNYVFINGNWYMGDALRSYYQSPNHGDGLSYNQLLLPAYNIYSNYDGLISKVNTDLWSSIANECYDDWSIYSKLKIYNTYICLDEENYIENIDELLYYNLDSFSVFCQSEIYKQIYDYIVNNSSYNVYRISYNNKSIEIYCYKK